MKEKKILNKESHEKPGLDVVDLWETTYKEYKNLLDEMEEDYRFRLGDQWDLADTKKLKEEGRPVLTINVCKKSCDIITGYQRQNFADIRVLPIENADVDRARVYTEVIKWIMAQKTNKIHVTYAFDDAVCCGLGWITADVRYDRDVVNGDIVIGHASPFTILPDPLFQEPDMSDASYILRYSWLSKGEIKSMYPDADISELDEEEPNEEYIQQPKAKGVKKTLIIEKWYRTHETKEFIIDINSEDVIDVTDPVVKAAILETMPGTKVLKRSIPVIKLITVAKDGTILYDGDHPHGTNMYPFFPVFGYLAPSFNELDLKIQGMIRILKDPQREKNKRRSQSMAVVMSQPYGGILAEKGFVDNPEKAFSTSQSGIKYIEYNPGKQFQQWQAPAIPSALIQFEQMSDNDIRSIGPNPDILGEQMSRSEPGINIQMRQKQGMTAIQEFFDNLSFAKQTLGNYIIALVTENFTDTKVSRILGTPVPEGFIEEGRDVSFDCVVDEVAESPTYRMGVFTTLANLKQQGTPIPDELLIELADIPKETKNLIMEPMKLQRELSVKQLNDQLNPPPPPPAPEEMPPEGMEVGEGMPLEEEMPLEMQGVPVDPNTGMPI